MATDITICSQSALKLGRNTFSDFTDGSREGEVFGPLYAQIIAEELGGEHWNFNIFVFKLTRDPTAPTDGTWTYRYQLPPNPLAFIKYMNSAGNPVPAEERSGWIYSNQSELYCKYRRKLTEDSFPEYFQAVLIWRLAVDASEALAADKNSIERAERNYARVLKRAKKVDGQNNAPAQLISNQSPWLHAHGNDGGFVVDGWIPFSG